MQMDEIGGFHRRSIEENTQILSRSVSNFSDFGRSFYDISLPRVTLALLKERERCLSFQQTIKN